MKANEKELYYLYAKLSIFKGRVKHASTIIREALHYSKRPYVACSWGKDSVCLLHLVAAERPGVDVIWVTTDEYDDWPGTEQVAKAFSESYLINIHTAQSMPVTECYRRVGKFYVFPDTEEKRLADKDYASSFLAAITDKAREISCDLAFIGLRQEESRGRRILLRKYGDTFYVKRHHIVESFPLSHWTGRDVWAYIVTHGLPYLDLYDLAPDREWARNGAMFAANVPVYGGESHYNGQLAALKKMYPDVFNRFAEEFPEVRCYV